jgi:hypothetical protein
MHLRKINDPLDRAMFDPRAFFPQQIGRNSLDVTCQISKLFLFGFFKRSLFFVTKI